MNVTNTHEGYESDVAAVIDEMATRALVQLEPFEVDGVQLGVNVFTGGDMHRDYVDFEQALPAPRRASGTVRALSSSGFITAFNLHRHHAELGAPAVVYLDEEHSSMVAVLNDDVGSEAGWRDYRVELVLRPTPEWKLWRSRDGVIGDQASFAELIEDGLPEIVRPDPASMLELAQTFSATIAAKFRQQGKLANGQTQYVYEEEVQTAAGDTGQLSVPADFELSVAPFIGSANQSVLCRLRTRPPREGKLAIGYKIVRPEEVESRAFDDIARQVEAALSGVAFVEGYAPLPR